METVVPTARLGDEVPLYKAGRSVHDALIAHDLESAIKLSSNELPYGALPSVERALVDALHGDEGLNRYPDFNAGVLRSAVAVRHGLDPSGVAVGCGSSSLVGQLVRAFAGPEDEVVVAQPSFDLYRIVAALSGAVPVAVGLRDHVVDVDALAAAVTSRTRLLFLANPNNPTSTAVASDAIQRLVGAVEPACIVVVDEAYIDFADPAAVQTATPMIADHPNVVVLRTFSKAHGLAALRVGYLLAHPDIVKAVDRVAPPFQVNALGQLGATASLAATTELQARVGVIVEEREHLRDALLARGWTVPRSEANFLWLPCGDAAGLAAALEAGGVVTRAIAGWGVRVTIGTADDSARFLSALDACGVAPASSETSPTIKEPLS